MNTLAIETSSKICGICILKENEVLKNINLNTGLTHSESLMPIISEALDSSNLKLSNINLIVCDIGPGSFTGIRIGVSTAMAFVDSLGLNYTGVSSLEALSYNIKKDGYICSIIDAKNENCYFALYNLKSEKYIEIIKPQATTINQVCENLKKINETITFVGDGACNYEAVIKKNISNCKFVSCNLNEINALNLALAGLDKIKSNKKLDLIPLYLKKPQAERMMEEKNANKN